MNLVRKNSFVRTSEQKENKVKKIRLLHITTPSVPLLLLYILESADWYFFVHSYTLNSKVIDGGTPMVIE